MRRPPSGATERERLTDITTRTTAILVLSAGGEIRVERSTIDQADFIELEQIDVPGAVIWRAKPHRRAAAGDIIEAEVREVAPTLAIEAPAEETHTCPECGKRFMFSSTCEIHRAREHGV